MMKPQRITVRYEGRVQGIGFRYTAVRLAQAHNLTGWVKNEPDGSVSLVAEGDEPRLMELLQAIHRSHLGKHITNEQVNRASATGEFNGFSVQH
ncbi:MAG: acylphosphatase [Pontiellaceae bacterium]|jgi:acylphosphatase|nr:acylphosphatase [Pontiellaceae bacterium]